MRDRPTMKQRRDGDETEIGGRTEERNGKRERKRMGSEMRLRHRRKG